MRVIVGRANAMMQQASTPKSFWAEAVATAVYLSNFTPTKGTKSDSVTPYELWNGPGAKPSLKHLRVWGCTAYTYIVKAKRKDAKFGPRAEKGVFIGYTFSQKQYKLYIPGEKRMTLARDVVFYEDSPFYNPKPEILLVPTSSGSDDDTPEHTTKPAINEPRITEIHDESDAESVLSDPPSPIPTPKYPSLSRTRTLKIDSAAIQLQRESAQKDMQQRDKQLVPAGMTGGFPASDSEDEAPQKKAPRAVQNLQSNLGDYWTQQSGRRTRRDFAHMVVAGPPSIAAALRTADAPRWVEAIESEMGSIESNQVFEVIQESEIPEDKVPISSRLLLQVKIDAEGEVEKLKARLVGHGFKQRPGIDFTETYTPLICLSTVRMVLSKAAAEDLEIRKIDVVTAYLKAEMKDELYMTLPKGFRADKATRRIILDPEAVAPVYVRVKKRLYGLRQSGLNWYETVREYFIGSMHLRPSQWESGIYFFGGEGSARSWGNGGSAGSGGDGGAPLGVVLVWVDDMLVIGSKKQVPAIIKQIASRFQIKDLGDADSFLGIKIVRDRAKRALYISSEAYIKQVLERFGMWEARSISTPMDKIRPQKRDPDLEPSHNQLEYQEAVGSLIYAAVSVRPDIAYAAGIVGRFAADPSEEHWTAVKRILRYLKGTYTLQLKLGICNSEGGSKGPGAFELHADADFAGDPNDLKSTSGMVIVDRNGAVIGWRSAKQPLTARSTADAEYTAVAMAVDEALWLSKVEAEIYGDSAPATLQVRNDNNAAISIIQSGMYQASNRHIGVKFRWLREMWSSGEIEISYIDTKHMRADGMTKPLDRNLHFWMLKLLGLGRMEDDALV
jgi:ribonuclease HI